MVLLVDLQLVVLGPALILVLIVQAIVIELDQVLAAVIAITEVVAIVIAITEVVAIVIVVLMTIAIVMAAAVVVVVVVVAIILTRPIRGPVLIPHMATWTCAIKKIII